MSKARIYGAAGSYIPNSQRDRRCRPKAYRHNKALADTAGDRACEKREKAQEKGMEQRMKNIAEDFQRSIFGGDCYG